MYGISYNHVFKVNDVFDGIYILLHYIITVFHVVRVTNIGLHVTEVYPTVENIQLFTVYVIIWLLICYAAKKLKIPW